MHAGKSSHHSAGSSKRTLLGTVAVIMVLLSICNETAARYRPPSDKPRLFYTAERIERLRAGSETAKAAGAGGTCEADSLHPLD